MTQALKRANLLYEKFCLENSKIPISKAREQMAYLQGYKDGMED
jgi:hypothetical protein